MSTTQHFQKKPDFYKNQQECREHTRNKINTNNRYSHFTQTHFTAGDIQQFNKYSNQNHTDKQIEINNEDNIWLNKNKLNICFKFSELTSECVQNTFQYMYQKFKKGIYIRIQDNKLAVFLPFSKKNYINEFGNNIKIDPKFRTFEKIIEMTQKIEGHPFNIKRINTDPKTWYANNCLIRYEYPLTEGDSGAVQIKDMFTKLCENRKLPDMSFFVNRRDFPILNKNGFEAYTGAFGDNIKLKSHDYEKYAPILSMNSRSDFCDIPIPTWEDWDRVRSISDGVFFPKSCRDYRYEFNVKWKDKKNIAVFRGASTGCGINIQSNMRMKIAYISQEVVPTFLGKKILDAGITSWNPRPRFYNGILTTIDMNNLRLVKKLSPIEQSKYKYIVDIDGHSSAYRLSLELSTGSVIMLVDSDYFLWYRKYLVEYVHYIPVKKDLSDLITQIEWCILNDDKCQKISENALEFYEKYLSMKSIFDYLQNTLIQLKNTGGYYVPISYLKSEYVKIQTDKQKDILKDIFNSFLKK